MKNQVIISSTSQAKLSCAIRTRFPEIEGMILAFLDGRFESAGDGAADIVIEDSDGGIILHLEDQNTSVFLERPFSKEGLENALNSLLPTSSSVGFSSDRERRLAIFGDRSVTLTPTEFRLFSAILENGDGFISAKDLSEIVWGKFDRNLCTVYISYLRRKLDGTFGVGTLITSSKKGYGLRDPHIT